MRMVLFVTLIVDFLSMLLYHCEVAKRYALVAQLDRVSDYESEGLGFESLRAHHKTLESHDSKVFSFASILIFISHQSFRPMSYFL